MAEASELATTLDEFANIAITKYRGFFFIFSCKADCHKFPKEQLNVKWIASKLGYLTG